MGEAVSGYENPELAEVRLTADVKHLLSHMDGGGNVPDEVFKAVLQNKGTGISEISMPYAVTDSEHEVVYRIEDGRRKRLIMWIGQTALKVAASGYKYHFSAPAFERVKIEEAVAGHAQDDLTPGIAQVLASPKMSAKDASPEIAKAEHLHADDSLQVSTAITNEQGEVVRRRLRSLLVRDISLRDWTDMLEDPDNLFGKAFTLRDKDSALSVMELFSQMDLPETALPEGPVTLVAAVLPYLKDSVARQSVEYQLKRFRGDQAFYAREAAQAGHEWALFDLELARSVKRGVATEPIRSFLLQNAGAWNRESLRVIEMHGLDDGQYAMTDPLVALLEQAKQKLLGDELSVITKNDTAITEVSPEARRLITDNHGALATAYAQNASLDQIYRLQQQQYQLLQRQPIRSGGGCLGAVSGGFGGGSSPDSGVGENDNPFRGGGADGEDSAENGACDYVHTGCYCCPYNVDGSERGAPMKVVARREANGVAYCKRPGCGAWLPADGKGGDIGGIARKARQIQKLKKARQIQKLKKARLVLVG